MLAYTSLLEARSSLGDRRCPSSLQPVQGPKVRLREGGPWITFGTEELSPALPRPCAPQQGMGTAWPRGGGPDSTGCGPGPQPPLTAGPWGLVASRSSKYTGPNPPHPSLRASPVPPVTVTRIFPELDLKPQGTYADPLQRAPSPRAWPLDPGPRRPAGDGTGSWRDRRTRGDPARQRRPGPGAGGGPLRTSQSRDAGSSVAGGWCRPGPAARPHGRRCR